MLWATATMAFLSARRLTSRGTAPRGRSSVCTRRPGTLHEGLAQDPVREAGAAAQALAGTLVVARAEARPGGRMARGGKAAHVTAEFGDDRLRGAAGHPRDGVEAR